jgi:hypothetical protein
LQAKELQILAKRVTIITYQISVRVVLSGGWAAVFAKSEKRAENKVKSCNNIAYLDFRSGCFIGRAGDTD